ncbi:MAG: hypothetical protein J6Y02_18700 [Pseudobutyrivibrio sp.]|nr:hypothetical protein [Pseudobutyrivibrio sp.]
MKKKLLAGVMGAFVLFFTLAPTFVSLADDPEPTVIQEVDPDNSVEPEETGEPAVVEPTDDSAGNPEKPEEPENPDDTDSGEPANPNQDAPAVDAPTVPQQEDLQNIELNNYLVLNNLDNYLLEEDMALDTILGTSLMATAAPVSESDENALIESAKFTIDGKDISGDIEVSKNSTFTLEYQLKDPLYINYAEEDYVEGKPFIVNGNTYSLPSIKSEYFDLSKIGSIPVVVDGKNFGTATAGTDGTIKLKVDYEGKDPEDIGGVFIRLSFGLDGSKVDNLQDFSFEIPGTSGQTVKISIAENQPKEPTIEKTAGELDENDDITWTVKVTNADNPVTYESGYQLVDTFGKGQSYKAGSFKVGGVDATPEYDDASRTLKYSFTDNTAGGVTTITYKTHVDFLAAGSTQNKNSISVNASNDVKIYDAGNPSGKPLGEVKVDNSVSKDGLSSWLTKEGGQLNDEGVADWTINVNTNGYGMKYLTVYDVIETDSTTVMGLVPDSVQVIDTATGQALPSSEYEVVKTAGKSDKGKKAYSWYVRFGNAASDYAISGDRKYTIKYKTQIDDYITFLRTNHTKMPSNHAFLEYQYDRTGNGDWEWLVGPTLDKTPVKGTGVTAKAAIEKSCTSFNPATHQITWKVVVNKNYQGLTTSYVTEFIGDGQKFVSISDAEMVAKSGGKSTLDLQDKYTVDGKEIKINFGDSLKETQATFTVVTELDETQASIWAGNASKTYKNDVQLDSDQQKEIKDEASCEYKSTVFEKVSGEYNYDTHEITYTLTVNRNEMAMSDVVVTDDIGSLGMSLNSDVTLVQGYGTSSAHSTTLTTDKSSKPHYSYSDGVLTVELEDITDVGSDNAIEAIVFTAKVDDGDFFTAVNGGNVSVSNTATLSTKDNPAGVVVTKKNTWKNSVIDKSAAVDTVSKAVTYTVTFNGNKQPLPSSLIVKDTLGTSLELDSTSVKLYLGEINPSTGEITSTGVEETGYSVEMSADGDSTILEVILPKEEDNRNIYVLTYVATPTEIKSGGDYSNKVQLVGYSGSGSNNSVSNLSYSSFGGGWTVKPTYLLVTKVDSEDIAVALPGATFVVKDMDGNVVAKIVTKANGVARSVGKLKPNTTYTIEEIEAPEGYELSTEVMTFTTAAKGGAENAVNLTFEDKKKSKTVDVSLVNQDGAALDGGNLEISRKMSDGSTKKVDSWKSDDSTHSFDASYDVEYTLTEKDTPFGYNTADNIVFKVVDDVLYKRNPDNTWGAVDSIVMTDAALDTCSFDVSKVSAGQGNELEGATLIISKHDTVEAAKDDYIKSWVSDGTAKEFALPSGEYYLYEISAPVGFEVAESIRFNITDEYALQIYDEYEGDFVDAGDAKLTMVDDYKADETATFTISPDMFGMSPDLFKSMKFALYRFDPIEGKLVEVEPVSYDEETGEAIYDINYQDEYLLKSDGEVEGYDPVDPITIKMVGTTDSNGDIVDSLKLKSLGDTVFTDSSVEELAKKLEPKLTPEPTEPEEPKPADENTNPDNGGSDPQPSDSGSSSGGDNGGSGSSGGGSSSSGGGSSTNGSGSASSGAAGPEVTDDGLIIKENNIVALDNPDGTGAGLNNGLAKTGGFIGTILGYVVAVALIAVGIILACGKEKRVK